MQIKIWTERTDQVSKKSKLDDTPLVGLWGRGTLVHWGGVRRWYGPWRGSDSSWSNDRRLPSDLISGSLDQCCSKWGSGSPLVV